MRGKARTEDKEWARKLRLEQRLSSSEISNILGVPRPNLSGWLKDIPLTLEEQRVHFQRAAKSRVYPPPVQRPREKRTVCTSEVGVQAVAVILGAFVKKSWYVSLPFGDHMAYDMILDKRDGHLLRVQCKEGHYKDGVVLYGTESVTVRAGGVFRRTGYRNRCDLFAVHCDGRVYLVPPTVASKGFHGLRLDPTRNGQQANVCWAKDYELK